MPDVPLLSSEHAATIEANIDMLDMVSAELRLKLANARAAQRDLDAGCGFHRRSDLKYVVLDNLRTAQRDPLTSGLVALGRLMLALETAENAVPLFES